MDKIDVVLAGSFNYEFARKIGMRIQQIICLTRIIDPALHRTPLVVKDILAFPE
jgi:hypothetical protein